MKSTSTWEVCITPKLGGGREREKTRVSMK